MQRIIIELINDSDSDELQELDELNQNEDEILLPESLYLFKTNLQEDKKDVINLLLKAN